ncbi:MAG: spinster family MFS transporter [Myxococcota bacterium]
MSRPEPQANPDPPTRDGTEGSAIGGRYPSYVLGVLVVVYVFNFIDRQILSILAEEIKTDLALSDAQIGFLYGTAFAVFYAIFGIPLGKLADVWTRRSLISLGLTFWSGMTALSGLARGFGMLATFRIGVGVGEASATPAAFSLLSDYFPPGRRATVLSIYSSGVYIGAGLGIFLGGWISQSWDTAWAGAVAPFGLKGWHVAFFAVGLPGLALAGWVRTLREPVRGISEGLAERSAHPAPFRAFATELAAVLPGLTLLTLYRAGGTPVVARNLLVLTVIAAVALGLEEWLGDPIQWLALGVGVYASISWIQSLALRDRASFTMIFQSRALLYSVTGFSCLAFAGYGLGFWGAPFFLREHGVDRAEAGTVLGLTAAVAGWAGVTLGGVVSDALRRRHPNGRLWVGLATASLPVPFVAAMLLVESTRTAYLLNVFAGLFAGMWIGPAASTVNDLVMPRMRAVASASYILVITFVGLALGPYSIGRISQALHDDLRAAMLISLVIYVPGIVLLALAMRHLPREQAGRLDRARAAGEQDL